VTLGNKDLANIINGFPGDPIDLHLFDKSLLKTTSRVGGRMLAFSQ